MLNPICQLRGWGGRLQNVTSWFPLFIIKCSNWLFSPRITKMPMLSHAEPLFIYQFTAKSKCSQVSNQTLQVLLINVNLQTAAMWQRAALMLALAQIHSPKSQGIWRRCPAPLHKRHYWVPSGGQKFFSSFQINFTNNKLDSSDS